MPAGPWLLTSGLWRPRLSHANHRSSASQLLLPPALVVRTVRAASALASDFGDLDPAPRSSLLPHSPFRIPHSPLRIRHSAFARLTLSPRGAGASVLRGQAADADGRVAHVDVLVDVESPIPQLENEATETQGILDLAGLAVD